MGIAASEALRAKLAAEAKGGPSGLPTSDASATSSVPTDAAKAEKLARLKAKVTTDSKKIVIEPTVAFFGRLLRKDTDPVVPTGTYEVMFKALPTPMGAKFSNFTTACDELDHTFIVGFVISMGKAPKEDELYTIKVEDDGTAHLKVNVMK